MDSTRSAATGPGSYTERLAAACDATDEAAAASVSSHDTSAGRTSVATLLGGPRAASTAATASAATSSGRALERYQPDIGRARLSMSLSSGASYCL